MKTQPMYSVARVRSAALVVVIVVFGFAAAVSAAELKYNIAANLGWFSADAWLDGDNEAASWSSGDTAVIVSTSTGYQTAVVIGYSESTAVDSLVLSNNLEISTGGAANLHTMTFNGGTIHSAGNGANGAKLIGIKLVGDIIKTGGSLLQCEGYVRGDAHFEGTMTVNEGSVYFPRLTDVMRTLSNVVVNDGAVVTLGFTPHADGVGRITVNTGGLLNIGRSADEAFTLNLVSLSGSGGILKVRGQIHGSKAADPANDRVKTLRINQSTDTVFNGSIEGVLESINKELYSDALFELIHQGSGTLTLGGSIHLERQTQVTAGRLNINSANTQFASRVAGQAAIRVGDGTLGGTGTITVTDDADVVLTAAGKLAVGIEGEAGRTTYSLNGGTLDLSAATAGAGTGWLKFDLGSSATPGVTYDQIQLTSGTLNIGTGLDFDSFAINPVDGFHSGTYVLFDAGEPIIGSLGAATGTINGIEGYRGELRLKGSQLLLDIINTSGSMVLLR